MARFFAVFYCMLLLSGCSVKRGWVSERPSNALYKEAGYGYGARYYTKENTDLIEDFMRSDIEKDGLKERDYVKTLKSRLFYSKRVGYQRKRALIKSYFENHRAMLAYQKPKSGIRTKNASSKDYFDIRDYNAIIPKENINRVIKLSTLNKLPMTSDFVHNVEYLHVEDVNLDRDLVYKKDEGFDNPEKNMKNKSNLSDKKMNEMKSVSLHHRFLDTLYDEENAG